MTCSVFLLSNCYVFVLGIKQGNICYFSIFLKYMFVCLMHMQCRKDDIMYLKLISVIRFFLLVITLIQT